MLAFIAALSLFTSRTQKGYVQQNKIVARTTCVCPPMVFITPSGFCEDKSRALPLVKSALAGGASIVQLRDRRASDGEIIHMTEWLLRGIGDPSKLSINGPVGVTLAREYPGLGVHLRQVDAPTLLSLACKLPACNIGCSAHSVESVNRALNYGRPSYFQVGTMFTTRTHPGKRPEGPKLLAEIRAAVPDASPLVAVGGIDTNNIPELMRLGADGVAVITAISNALDPAEATARLVSAVDEALKERSRTVHT